MESNAKLDISLFFDSGDFDEPRRSGIRNYLLGILSGRDMTLCTDTFKVYVSMHVLDMHIFYHESFQLMYQYSRLEPLPQFRYMSYLHVTLDVSHLKWMPTFLVSFPNLEYFILVMIC